MNTKRVTDMTTGNVAKHLIAFAFPLFLGNMFQQLYNMVDTLVMGNYVGANALAATGTCGSINFLFFSLSAGLANGVGIIISQYFGAKDEKSLKTTIANAFYVLITASIMVSIIGIFLSRFILEIMNTPAEIINDSVIYLRTTCSGILFIALYNFVAATLRALGDSKTPLFFLILSSSVNIALDLTFVLVFHMGVFGVALATVISQATSAAVSLFYAFVKVPYFRISRDDMKPHYQIIAQTFRIGIPMALQSSMIAISMMVLQGVVNSFGAVVMAAYTITSKVDLIVSQVYNAMSMATTTYSGQNIGAGNIDRVKEGFRKGAKIVFIYNLIMVPLVYIFSGNLVNIFISEADAAVVTFGTRALHITSVMYFFLGMIYIPRGVMNGCGDATFSMINGISEVICRILFSNLLTGIAAIGVWGIWWASGLTWFTVSIICFLRYLSGVWQRTGIKNTIVPEPEPEPRME